MSLVQSQLNFPCRKPGSARRKLIQDDKVDVKELQTLPESTVLEKRVTRSRTRQEVVNKTSPYKRSPCKPCPSSSPKKAVKSKVGECVEIDENAGCSDAPPAVTQKLQLCVPDVSSFSKARQALHTSHPETLMCREQEIETVKRYFSEHISSRRPGSLYISGAPGTGKTATVMHILSNNLVPEKFDHCFINCMKVNTATSIYSEIARQWDKNWESKEDDALRFLEKKASAKGPMMVLVLDEIDYMSNKTQSVLYTLFELPALKNSRVILVGLANSLDLTDRILVRLQSRVALKPDLVHFSPYTKQQIATILSHRVKEAISDESSRVIAAPALLYLSGKISATSGDLRKALDICRRAVELAETSAKKQLVLTAAENNSCHPVKAVDIGLVSKLVSSLQSHSFCTTTGDDSEEAMPIQHKISIATLLVLVKHGKSKQVTLGKMHNSYTKICKKFNLTPMEFGEFLNTCVLNDAKGIFTVKRKPDARLSIVTLRLDEREVEATLRDKTLLATILTQAADFI